MSKKSTASEDGAGVKNANSPASHKELAAQADALLFDALEICGFHRNIWSFDPWYVRIMLRSLTYIFAIASIYSWSHHGWHRWTFTSFGAVLGALNLYWYYSVECGGGLLIFSNDWRDSFVRTEFTTTNYVVHINVGYMENVTISIPFTSFEESEVSLEWLSKEVLQALPKHLLGK